MSTSAVEDTGYRRLAVAILEAARRDHARRPALFADWLRTDIGRHWCALAGVEPEAVRVRPQ